VRAPPPPAGDGDAAYALMSREERGARGGIVGAEADAGIVGTRPLCINVDGHCSNYDNALLEKLMLDNNVLCLIPPSHTSADKNGMGTQQGDRPAH
jgi:hypothetical protein